MAGTATRAPDLGERLAHECDSVIATEIERLRRRRPALSTSDLALLERVLVRLADRLLLDAVRGRPALHESVSPLFSAESLPGKAHHD